MPLVTGLNTTVRCLTKSNYALLCFQVDSDSARLYAATQLCSDTVRACLFCNGWLCECLE